MSAIKLSTPSSGSISLSPANTASNLTITVPAVSATMATLTTPSFATTIGVGGATPATSGAGITFPATKSPSSDANTLDDYEEGTWLPNVGGNTTYADRFGRYTKIGNIVSCQFFMQISSLGTGSTTTLSGFPFTSQNIAAGTVQSGCVGYWGSLAVNTIFISFYINNNSTQANFVGKATSGATVDNAIAIFGNSTNIYGSITYTIA